MIFYVEEYDRSMYISRGGYNVVSKNNCHPSTRVSYDWKNGRDEECIHSSLLV